MKFALQLFAFLGSVVATGHALSCACVNPSPNLSNALYNKPYAVKVRVKKEIPRPTPAPITPIDPSGPVIAYPYMPASWLPTYYTAKVKNIFKQPDEDSGELTLEDEEEIVVQAGSCSPNPEEKTPYIIITHGLYEMDVPGYGKAKVLAMPAYCEFNSKWRELEDKRVKQLRKYKRKGKTPCFETDCDSHNVFVATPILQCPDGSSAPVKEVCEYSEKSNMCVKDWIWEDCPDIQPLPLPQPMPLPQDDP